MARSQKGHRHTGMISKHAEAVTIAGTDPCVSRASQAAGDTLPVPVTAGLQRRRAAMLIGSVFFAASAWYIARTYQWAAIATVLERADVVRLLVGGGATMILYWACRALRWHILLKRTGTAVPFLDLYVCTAASLSVAPLTPLQSGEVLKIELLRKRGLIRRAPGYGSFVVERALDLATVIAMAGASSLATSSVLTDRSSVPYPLAALTVACVAGVIVVRKAQSTGRVGVVVGHIRECVGDAPTLVLVVLLTCTSWASVAFTWQVLLSSGPIPLGFASTFAMMTVVGLASVLSFVPGGLGVAEVGTSQILMHHGFDAPTAQAGALLLRCYTVIALALGAAHSALWTLAIRRRRRLALAARQQPHGC